MRKKNEFKSRHDYMTGVNPSLPLEDLRREMASLRQELLVSWTDRYK